MKLDPSDSRHGISTLRLALTLLAAALVPLLAFAAAPSWWSQRGVLVPGAPADDYAPVNQGQLKNIARAAVAQMDAALPGGAGDALHNLVNAWASPTAQTNDFAPVNLGQLKNVAKPFYERLIAAGVNNAYPWSGSSNPPDDFALANIGQVKKLFSFDLSGIDTDGNGLPDAWEMQYFGHLGVDPNADPDGDGLTNLQEYQNHTAPDDYYNGAAPQLVLLAGDGQTVKTDSNAPRAFELLVLKADGTPLPNAPITFAVASGEGLLAGDATAGAPLSASVTVRADYSGRVRPPVATVLYHASSSPGTAIVQASAQSAVAQYSMTVTTDGPLAAPTLLSATQNPEDGSTLFQWSQPPSGIPAASAIALLGRGADGVWHTIASLSSSTTSYSAAANEVAPYTEFALRVFPAGNGNPSPLSNILGGSSGGGSSGLPSYAVIDLGVGRRPMAVASDGTVVLSGDSLYRKRGQVEEVLDPSFGFSNMNDLGDIAGFKSENGAYSAYALLASGPASILTRWARPGHGGASYLATALRQINEKRTVAGYESMVEPAGGTLRFNSGTTFTSNAPLSLNTIASYSYTYDWSWERKTGATGNSYNFRDLDNHGRAVGRENHVITNTETPVYYGFGTGPKPSGDSAFDPIALNDDGLVLGLSNNVARLWEPSTGFRTLALPNPVDQGSPMRVTDPPASDPDKTVIILAGDNIVFRTWKDADGQPSAFPIYTSRAAADLLPPDSPYYYVRLQNISNNGIIVAIARKVGDDPAFIGDHAIMLVPVTIQKLWSDQLPGVTDANFLPNWTGGAEKPYLLLGAAQSDNFDLKGHLKAKVTVPAPPGIRDRILWRLVRKGGDSSPEIGSSTYNADGTEVTIVVDNPTNDFDGYYLVAGYDDDGIGQLSALEASIRPKYRWEQHQSNGAVITKDHEYEVKIVSRSSYNDASDRLGNIARSWDATGAIQAARLLEAFLHQSPPVGATGPPFNISRTAKGLSHAVGILFQPPGNFGTSIAATFPPLSETTAAVLSSTALNNWLQSSFEEQSRVTEVHQRFEGSTNAIEPFHWNLTGDLSFTYGIDSDLFLAFHSVKFELTADVEVNRSYQVISVKLSGSVVDLYDFDYDYDFDGARVQSGYNTLGIAGRVFGSDVQMNNSVVENFQFSFE
jgi:hypothetical protein